MGGGGGGGCCIKPGFSIVNRLFILLSLLSMESGMLHTWWNLLELFKMERLKRRSRAVETGLKADFTS